MRMMAALRTGVAVDAAAEEEAAEVSATDANERDEA